ncbi:MULTISPECIES: hypothetical protein [Pseudomonas]|uniref:Uncharacterized protein n=1 Tax=Pseudomonas helleri TaxID=1608996 RepID=A0A6L5HM29_9PSED|nr:hypothetical protein [Pseudomonas helleri]MQU04432.1 hypothetical protein [Pseudomonas helleri]
MTLFSVPNAEASDWGFWHQFGYNTQSKNLEANYNEEERIQATIFPLIESAIGCKLTQEARAMPFGNNWFFTGEYACRKDSNRFNSNSYLLLNAPLQWINMIFTVFLGGWIARKIIMTFIEVMIDKSTGKESIIGYVLLIAVAFAFLLPIYKSSDDQNAKADTTLAMMSVYTGFAVTYSYGSYALHVLIGSTPVEQPYVAIPEPMNQRTKEVLNMIDYQLCARNQPGSGKQTLQFNRYDGHITAFTQVGSCVLNIDHEIDEGTIAVAASNGLPSLYQVEVEALTDAYTNMMSETYALVTKVNNHKSLNKDVARSLDRTMSCEQIKTFSPDLLDMQGLKEYMYDSANCIGGEFVSRMTRAPGVTEASLQKSGDRNVKLCEDSTTTDVEGTQRACAQKMCDSDSSPYFCSAQINNYTRLLGVRFMTDPNYATLGHYFMLKYYNSSQFADYGKTILNSMQIDSYVTQDLVQPIIQGEPSFTVPYEKTTGTGGFSSQDFAGVYQSETTLNKDVMSLLVEYFTIPGDGLLGKDRTLDCIAHPFGKSPSGRICPSVQKTLDMQGNRLMLAAAEIRAGTKAASIMRQSPLDKAKNQAGVEAAEAAMKQSAKMWGGSDAMVGFILSGTINSAANDVFSEYGSKFGPEPAYVIAAVYASPDIADFANSTANALWAMGMYLKFGIPLAFGMVIISFFMDALVKITKMQFQIVPHFVLLLGKHGVNPNNDTWKPFQLLMVNFMSWAIFGIIILLCLGFIDVIFVFQIIPFSAFNFVLGESPNASSLVSAIDQMMKLCLFVVFISFLINAIFKFATSVTGEIVSRWSFGNFDKSDRAIDIDSKKPI